MKLFRGNRPTPALLISMLALVLALGGTAIAFNPSKKNVKNIAKKQAGKIFDQRIGGATVANAGTANTATTAQNVNGQTVTRIFAKVPLNSTQTLGTFDQFTLRVTCNAAGNVEDLDVDPQTTDADLSASGNGNVGPIFSFNLGSEPNNISLDDDGTNDNDRGNSTFSAARSGGVVVSGNISYDDTNSFDNQAVCAVYGHVTQGA